MRAVNASEKAVVKAHEPQYSPKLQTALASENNSGKHAHLCHANPTTFGMAGGVQIMICITDSQSTQMRRKPVSESRTDCDTPRRALLAEARVLSISPPLRLPYVWTGWYEGHVETEDATAGARVPRNNMQQGGGSGNLRADADMALHFASIATLHLRLQRMRTSGTKGNAQGRRGEGWESAAAIGGAAVVHPRPAHVLAPGTKESVAGARGRGLCDDEMEGPLRCCTEQRAHTRRESPSQDMAPATRHTHPVFPSVARPPRRRAEKRA
ncbi:hypothetical protein B0H13DRAFT_2518835 [Mycena leptocephala]|nr:hypothetical protein B0H13DRAFT_2518835 [Mycena leptocephala]